MCDVMQILNLMVEKRDARWLAVVERKRKKNRRTHSPVVYETYTHNYYLLYIAAYGKREQIEHSQAFRLYVLAFKSYVVDGKKKAD